MDWLSKLKANIVCFEKILKIPLFNRQILEFHGDWPEGNLKQMMTIKVDELKLEDILVICNYPGVFLEDLSDLPPSRKVEFLIDCILGVMPVAKSPYRLARTKLQELSNQLKELKDKVFIRPSSSHYKASHHIESKDKKFEWGDEHENAFQKPRDTLCDALILALPE
nr:putative reverse transcriptase domain-containing protein [Tanacetum cinerariifolium]